MQFSLVNAQDAEQVPVAADDEAPVEQTAPVIDSVAAPVTKTTTEASSEDSSEVTTEASNEEQSEDVQPVSDEEKPVEVTSEDGTGDETATNADDEEVPEDLDSIDYDSFEKKEIAVEQEKLKKALPVSLSRLPA